ncbi:unnamed protein product, partial [Closterium sp. NIES-54]
QDALFRTWWARMNRIPLLGRALLASVPQVMRMPGGHTVDRPKERTSRQMAAATCLLLPPLIIARLLAANVTAVYSDINSVWLRDARPYFPPSYSLVLPSLSHQDLPQQQQQQHKQQPDVPAMQGAQGAKGAAENGLGNSTVQVGEGGGSTGQAEAPATQAAQGVAEKTLGNGTEQVGGGGGSTQQAGAHEAQRAAERGLRAKAESKGGDSMQQAAAPAPPNTTALTPSLLGSLSPWLMALRPSPAVQAMVRRWALRALRDCKNAEAAEAAGGSGVFSGSEILKRALNHAVAEMVREAGLVGAEEIGLGEGPGSAGGIDAGTEAGAGAGTEAGKGGGTGDVGEGPTGASVGVLPEQLFPPGWKVVGDRAWLEAHRNEIVAVQVSCGQDSKVQEMCVRDMKLWL